ncbi:Fructose-bisphosphate aldolase, chloroplastic [Glycine soja]|nr:hypothetical protein JHK87_013928 [Glycine soja]KHN20031.1 Fructose-bisphosphate aldolase, chloroplastic [Glycine soja]
MASASATLLKSSPGLGEYISATILFEETLYQNIVPGNKTIETLCILFRGHVVSLLAWDSK